MTEPQAWKRTDAFVQAEMDGGLVILDIESGRYYALSETAHAIWQTVEAPRTIPEICQLLTAQYAVSAEACAKSTSALLLDLKGKGLVEAVEAS